MKPELKYRVIYRHKEKFSIVWMYKYFEVSRSSYYDWQKRMDRVDKNQAIVELISKCQEQSKKTYGYRRVKIWLLRETGLAINHKAVLRLMNKYGLLSEIRKPRPLYMRQQSLYKYQDKLNRDFVAEKPNSKWVTDISYIHTKQGVLYLLMIKDLYDNFVVAYDMGTVQDNALIYRTINKAKREVANGLILHSDQGFQYTSRG